MSTSQPSPGQQKIYLLGAGGHAKVVLDLLKSLNLAVHGVSDPGLKRQGITAWRGLPVMGDDDLLALGPVGKCLVNGIGSLPGQSLRERVFEKFRSAGFEFATLVHPFAFVATDVILGEGAQIMAGCCVQPDTRIGTNSIVNTGACIDHDCTLGDHVHVAPGAVLSGGVRVGTGTHVGTGAAVIQGISLGENSVVGAGTTVLHDVPANAVQVGTPPPPARKKDDPDINKGTME